jgi:hypothetical protein
VTRAGANIIPSYIRVGRITGSTDLYLQETILRLQVCTWLNPCIGMFVWRRVGQSRHSCTHTRYVCWMGLNGQLHPPPVVVNIIPVGQGRRWVADRIRTGGAEVQSSCPFWESIPATWIKLQRRNLQTVLNFLSLIKYGRSPLIFVSNPEGEIYWHTHTHTQTRITPPLLWKIRFRPDHVCAADVGCNEDVHCYADEELTCN